MKHILFVVASALIITGCATTASPMYLNGNYYMAGDQSCFYSRPISDTRIMCLDKERYETGYRDAMSYEQVQIYHQNQYYQQVQIEELSETIRQTGESFQNSSQQYLQQSQQYTAPQVQSLSPYNSSGVITYRQVGSTIVGSDGTTINAVGSSFIGSDGSICQLVNEAIICN